MKPPDKFDGLEIIQKRLAGCNINCAGIVPPKIEDPHIFPRCLYFHQGDGKSRNAILVGENPGRLGIQERLALDDIPSIPMDYFMWLDNFHYRFYNELPYFSRSQDLLRRLGFSGDLLWTETYHCQNRKDLNGFQASAATNCTKNFLVDEVKAFDAYLAKSKTGMPVMIALGMRVHKHLENVFPNRKLIGLFHPSNSYGNHFDKYFDQGVIVDMVNELRSDGSQKFNQAWLDARSVGTRNLK